MSLNTQSFDQIVANFAAAVQGVATQLIDFTVGSILRAIGQAAGGMALWLQGLALQIAALTRFATSNGTDADSWAADFGFTRLPSQPATDPVTFSRFTPTVQAVIPAAVVSGTDSYGRTLYSGGTIVQSEDGTEQYQVIPDTNQVAYSPTLGGYVIAASVSSCTATVQALTPGSSGNVGAGIVSVLGSAIAGVDTVTNASAFTTGADAESDPAFKARFVAYIQSLEKGTPLAVETAILSVQEGVSQEVVENFTYAGAAERGNFYAVVDDGSGDPPSGFITACANAIEAVRPIGTTYGVFGPVEVTVPISLTVTVEDGYNHATIAPLVQTAIEDYVDALALGATLFYTKLYQVAYDAATGIAEVSALTVNSGTSDITCTNQQVVKSGTVTVS